MNARQKRVGAICWQCQSRLLQDIHYSGTSTRRRLPQKLDSSTFHVSSITRRQYNNSQTFRRRAAAVATASSASDHLPTLTSPPFVPAPSSVRTRLAEWNELNAASIAEVQSNLSRFEPQNSVTRQGTQDDFRTLSSSDGDDMAKDFTDKSVAEDSGVDDGNSTMLVHRGDLVELQVGSSDGTALAVHLRTNSAVKAQMCFLTIKGKWVVVPRTAISYVLSPRYIDLSLLDPVLPYIPADAIEADKVGHAQTFDSGIGREVVAPIVGAMQSFMVEAEEAYRKHATNLDQAYDLLAHQTDLRFGSLHTIAKKLLGHDEISLPELYTVRKALVENPDWFTVDKRSHRTTGLFQIRSIETVQILKSARDWIRVHQEHDTLMQTVSASSDSSVRPKPTRGYMRIQKFVRKAARLIKRSRENRPVTEWGLGLSNPEDKEGPLRRGDIKPVSSPAEDEFDDDDRVLIRFMELWCAQGKYTFEDIGFRSLPPYLLRATGMYHERALDRKAGMMFLAEIGVLAPWSNPHLNDPALLLPMSQHSRPLQQLNSLVERFKPEAFEYRDTMAAYRHDWGNLTVFTIDDAGAMEIDDGVSIEKVKGQDAQWWIHVHVANPSAFLARDSIFSRMAAHMTESFYSPDMKIPMLPQWLSTDFFSLAPNRPCLTISARINGAGEILDTRIRNATIRKVKKLTYAEANVLLNIPNPSQWTMIVGVGQKTTKPAKPKPAKLDPHELSALQELLVVYKSRLMYRINNGGLNFSGLQPSTTVYRTSQEKRLDHIYPDRTRGRHWFGDPSIRFEPDPFRNAYAGEEGATSGNVIREMMLLAGEATAKWMRERNVPFFYRGQVRNPDAPDRATFERDVLKPSLDEYNTPSYKVANEYGFTFGFTTIAPQFVASHAQLGVGHYCKVTSPLRRYGDLVSHHQIESVLKWEAEHGKTFDATKTERALAYREDQIKVVISRLEHREKLVSVSKTFCIDFWNAQFFQRAWAYKQRSLPDVFRVVIVRAKTSYARVEIPGKIMDLGLDVSVTADPKDMATWNLGVGDVVEASFVAVDTYMSKITVKAQRVVCREPELNALLRAEPPGAKPW